MNNYRYEQTNDSKKKRNKQEVVEFILEKDYGTTIEDRELAYILKYNIRDEEEFRKYKNMMSGIRNFLLQYGYVLKSVQGIGYYILKPSQISNHCYKTYIKQANRLYDKSANILDRVDKMELSKERLEEIQNLMELNKELINNAQILITESKYYSRKDYYDSLEDNKDNNKSKKVNGG